MKNSNLHFCLKIVHLFISVLLACLSFLFTKSIVFASVLTQDAREIPIECLGDDGSVLEPDILPGWLFVTNFNVQTPEGVRGCLIQADSNNNLIRSTFVCSIVGDAEVVSGSAMLNGNGFFSCPFNIWQSSFDNQNRHGNDVLYDYFWVRADIQSELSNLQSEEMTLFSHNSVELRTSYYENSAHLFTRFGDLEYASNADIDHIGSNSVTLNGSLKKGVVTHEINGSVIFSAQTQPSFLFSTLPGNISIGQLTGNTRIVLSEILVDPGGHCCSQKK